MSKELVLFIEKAIQEQELPYKIVETQLGFKLSLDLEAKDFIQTNNVTEQFIIEAVLSQEQEKKYASLVDTIYRISFEGNSFVQSNELTSDEANGYLETEEPTFDDTWKIYKAKRWLLSLLEFKEYGIKEEAKNKKTFVIAAIGLLVVGVILAFAFSGISEQMVSGFSGFDDIVIEDPDEPINPDEVLNNFFG